MVKARKVNRNLRLVKLQTAYWKVYFTPPKAENVWLESSTYCTNGELVHKTRRITLEQYSWLKQGWRLGEGGNNKYGKRTNKARSEFVRRCVSLWNTNSNTELFEGGDFL